MQERLKLDLFQKTSTSQGITSRVNDSGIHTIEVTALNYGDVFDLTGYKIIFELTTSAKTIAFDPNNTKITDAKNGEFTYIIPKEITGVAGDAERAYFAFEKDGNRITSADISMTILQIIDVSAEEAKSYISEYNKLVEELKSLQEKAIEDMQSNLSETNKKIAEVETKVKKLELSIVEYQKTVKETADKSVEKIEELVKDINAKDSYSKEESNEKFVGKTQIANEKELGIVKLTDEFKINQTNAALSSAGAIELRNDINVHLDSKADKSNLALKADKDTVLNLEQDVVSLKNETRRDLLFNQKKDFKVGETIPVPNARSYEKIIITGRRTESFQLDIQAAKVSSWKLRPIFQQHWLTNFQTNIYELEVLDEGIKILSSGAFVNPKSEMSADIPLEVVSVVGVGTYVEPKNLTREELLY